MHPQLVRLDLAYNNIGRYGCTALATLLQCTNTQLQKLNLFNGGIDNKGVEVLINALTSNSLIELDLGYNRSITVSGWKKVATLLELPNSKLEALLIQNNSIGDEGALVFAKALANNSTLKTLEIHRCGISDEGWAPFSRLLCDTISVNNTYLSNHTLEHVGHKTNDDDFYINKYLMLNSKYRGNKEPVAMIKILYAHSHFNMVPFFEWEFKVLPLMIKWFANASKRVTMYEQEVRRLRLSVVHDRNKVSKMKLSVIYDFIKDLPMLYIEPVTRQELTDYTALEEQIQAEGGQMGGDQEVRLEKVRQLKARAIMRRLGMK